MSIEGEVRSLLEDVYIEGTRHTMGFKRERKLTIEQAISAIIKLVKKNNIEFLNQALNEGDGTYRP